MMFDLDTPLLIPFLGRAEQIQHMPLYLAVSPLA